MLKHPMLVLVPAEELDKQLLLLSVFVSIQLTV